MRRPSPLFGVLLYSTLELLREELFFSSIIRSQQIQRIRLLLLLREGVGHWDWVLLLLMIMIV